MAPLPYHPINHLANSSTVAMADMWVSTWINTKSVYKVMYSCFIITFESKGVSRTQLLLIPIAPSILLLPMSSQSTLQVPGTSSTRRLRPPSPRRTQPGFVVPPKDSRSSITQSPDPRYEPTSPGQPGPLGLRPASPRPPAPPKKQKESVSKAKQTAQGKVS